MEFKRKLDPSKVLDGFKEHQIGTDVKLKDIEVSNMSCGTRFPTSGMCDQQSLRSACAYAQSDQSFCFSIEYSRTLRLLIEHHLEFLSLKGGCTGSCESTLIEIPHCIKS